MTWATSPLGDLVTLKSGGTPSKKRPDYWDGSIPWVTAKDMHGIRFYDSADHLTDRAVLEGAKLASPGDLLILVRGMRLAKELAVGEVMEPVSFNQDVKAVTCDGRMLPRFLLYWLLANEWNVLGEMDEAAHGTKRLQTPQLMGLEVPVPPESVQRRVVEVLSAYDDLIENNDRRMVLLEDAIRLLYREWFVYLRFPGHDRDKVLDGVPEGWSRGVASDVIDFDPRTTVSKDEERPFVPMGSLSTTSLRLVDLEERVPKGGAKFKNDDTLLARITPCLENGKTGFVQFMETDEETATGSTEFIVMRGAQVPPTWVYCLARSPHFRQHAINSMTGSDGRQRVGRDSLEGYELPVPPAKLLREWDEAARPVFTQIQLLNDENAALREARDLLLPRLMNGSIAV